MQDWKRVGKDLVGEVMPRIIDAATAYSQSSVSNDARELAHIDDLFDAEWQSIEGALVKAQKAWEIANWQLADARDRASKCDRAAYEAGQRGSRELAIDYLRERQQANAVIAEYESLLPQLESNLDGLIEDRQVLESEYGKLRQKVLALHLRRESAKALSEVRDGLKTLEKVSKGLQDEQKRVDNDAAQVRADLKGARQSPHLRRGYLERADLENQLKELMERQHPDVP
ncbi:MAG: PspA/IM30 family protein [Candidatus Binatia bacterium]